MDSDVEKTLKNIVAVSAEAGVVAGMLAFPVIMGVLRNGRTLPADHAVAHKAGEHTIKRIEEWRKRR